MKWGVKFVKRSIFAFIMTPACLNIIHLPHRKDRFGILEQELLMQKISNFKIWDGIVDPTLPVRGICRAHKQIIRAARVNRQNEVLIAEDDIQFTASGAFEYFISCKPHDFDLYLGGITWGKIREDNSIEDFSGTSLYFIHERFYETLLNIPEETDWDRSMAGLGKFIVCNPMVAIQHSGYSDNRKDYLDFGPSLRRMKWFNG